MEKERLWKRGISPLIATVILIAITISAGLAIYTLFFSTFSTLSASLDIQVISIDIVEASGTKLVSATIKNIGNKPIQTCNVTIYGDSSSEATLNLGSIEPGQVRSASKAGDDLSDFSVTAGNSYPVKIEVKAADGSTFAKSLSVICMS